MVETSDEPSLIECIRRRAHVSKSTLLGAAGTRPTLTLFNTPVHHHARPPARSTTSANVLNDTIATTNGAAGNVADNTFPALPPPAPPPPAADGQGETSATIDPEKQPNWAIRFYHTSKEIILSSYINILLVFVPVGIAVNFTGVNPTIVFAMNAIAIIPLAWLLSHATESVAISMGDTVGALMNITFGNAVELIIFIALVKNELRIVQASLLGSILANLLLILGMCFLFGGLRFREQIYNSTVTQMSACLLSLSVMSLLLPTAFHASFTDTAVADVAVLQVSRGTSIILLLVYVLYLLFQLKSHAYMYESTPQHVIDEESHPGLLADMLNSSSSSDASSSPSENDSDASSGSNTTAKRIRRALRGRKRRKSSASSKDTPSMPSAVRTPSEGTFSNTHDGSDTVVEHHPDTSFRHGLGVIASGDEADTDGECDIHSHGPRRTAVNYRDFENEKSVPSSKMQEPKSRKKSRQKHRKANNNNERNANPTEKVASSVTYDHEDRTTVNSPSPRVSFVQDVQIRSSNSPKRPFNLRGLSVRPTMPKMLTSTVFSAANPTGSTAGFPNAPVAVPRAPYGLRRTNSLPDRLNKTQSVSQEQPLPHLMPVTSNASAGSSDDAKDKKYLTQTSAIILLLVSTGLVALCANFLVGSINYLVNNTNVSEAFIGLIILPIVGNAAEHVTAVTVASKNKMDLAISVAVGSSIQIALFVTPVIVLLGWTIGKDMSLYFSLFETISLFVSAFIVNFLVLDGRSNYLEGALLIAAYVIIAVAAFFYPDSSQQSTIGGAEGGMKMMFKYL